MGVEHEIGDLAFMFASEAGEHIAIQLRADVHDEIYNKALDLVRSKMDRIKAEKIDPVDAAQHLAEEIVWAYGGG